MPHKIGDSLMTWNHSLSALIVLLFCFNRLLAGLEKKRHWPIESADVEPSVLNLDNLVFILLLCPKVFMTAKHKSYGYHSSFETFKT